MAALQSQNTAIIMDNARTSSMEISSRIASSMQHQLAQGTDIENRVHGHSTTEFGAKLPRPTGRLERAHNIHLAAINTKSGRNSKAALNICATSITESKNTTTKLSDETLDLSRGRCRQATEETAFRSSLAYRSDSLNRNRSIHIASRSSKSNSTRSTRLAARDFASEAKNARKLGCLRDRKKSVCEKLFGRNRKGKAVAVVVDVAGHEGITGTESDERSVREQRTRYFVHEQAERVGRDRILSRHIKAIIATSTVYHNADADENDFNGSSTDAVDTVSMSASSANYSMIDHDPEFSSELSRKLREAEKEQRQLSYKVKECAEKVNGRFKDWVMENLGLEVV